LSFWDLFPEDLPPVRPGGFTVDDTVIEGPPEAAPPPDLQIEADLFSDAETRPANASLPSAATKLPSPPPAAEIVIAELLDGPAPATRRAAADPDWSLEGSDRDLFISDLLADNPGAAVRQARQTVPEPADTDEDDNGGDGIEPTAEAAGRSPEEACARALNTSGRAVLFAGGTVMVALLGLLVLRVNFLNGVAIAASLTPLNIGAGMVVVADGSENSRRRLERVLTSDPGMGVLRHADAGYSSAIDFACSNKIDLPTEPKARD